MSFLRARASFLIKIGVAIALIVFVARGGFLKLSTLKDLLTVQDCVIGFVLLGINLWVLNWRWCFLLRSRGFKVGLWHTFSLYLIGIFFNHALPSSVGGDVVKAYYIAQEQASRRMEAVLSVLIDRLLGLYSMLILSLVGVLFDFSFAQTHRDIQAMALLCAALVLAMTIAFWIGFSKTVDQWIGLTAFLRKYHRLHFVARLFEAMHVFGERRMTIFISIAVSAGAQLMAIGFFILVAFALGVTGIGLPAFLFCVPLGFVATALPIAPAGVGVGQVAFLFLFEAYAPGKGDLGAAGITAFQLCTLMWGLVGSGFYLRYKRPQIESP